MAIDVLRLVERAEARFFPEYRDAVSDMLAYKATGDRDKYLAAVDRLSDSMVEAMRISTLIGAADQMRSAAAIVARDGPEMLGAKYDDLMAFAVQPLALAVIAFEEAVQDVRDRLPIVLVDSWNRTAQRIAEAYGRGNVIAFTRSAEFSVTKRAQSLIEQAIAEGWGEVEAGIRIAEGVESVRERGDAWTEAYSRMAFRTNLNTATTAGRFKQAQEPLMQTVLPAMRFDAVGDVDTRHNHKAADGVVLRVTNPAWSYLAPPLGFQCRCTVVQMSLPQLRRMGRLDANGNVIESNIPPAARPDDGFRPVGRSDLMLGMGGA